MALRMIMTFKAKPGVAEEMQKAFAPIVGDYRNAKGCLQYELFASTEEPDKFVLLQRWDSNEDMENFAINQRRRGTSPIAEYREGDAVIERFEK